MKFIMRYYLICIFLCAPSLIKAQAYSEYLQKADSFFLSEKYEMAALYYERSFFQSPDVASSAITILKKVECLKRLKWFADAISQLDKIRFDVLPAGMHAKWRYEKAYCAFMNNDFELMENENKLYDAFETDTIFRKTMLFLNASALINQFKWKDANIAMDKYFRFVLKDSIKNQEVFLQLEKKFKHVKKYRNPDKARKLSFLPGLGQLYAGYPLEGCFSFILNAAALSFGAYHILNGFPFTGYFGGAGILQSFYFGGQNRAATLCNKRNEKNRRLMSSKMIKFMMESVQ